MNLEEKKRELNQHAQQLEQFQHRESEEFARKEQRMRQRLQTTQFNRHKQQVLAQDERRMREKHERQREKLEKRRRELLALEAAVQAELQEREAAEALVSLLGRGKK